MADVSIAEMLAGFGISDAGSQQSALVALVAAGVVSSRPNRTRIAADKRERVGEVLAEAFFQHCHNGDCRQQAASAVDPRALLLVDQPFCEVCHGVHQPQRPGADGKDAEDGGGQPRASGRRYRGAGAGDPRQLAELRRVAVRDHPDVPGRPGYYRSDRDWADVIVFWASTPLPHKVSRHFESKGDGRKVSVTRRGVAALADEVRQHLER